MKIVLITGGIASGKSVVCRYLAEKGYPVYDSDSRTKSLYDSVPGLKERVEQAIGAPFSEIGIIFKDSAKRNALERVVHPEVLSDFERWKSGRKEDFVIFESAIALERPLFRDLFDITVLVESTLENRMERNPKTAVRHAVQNTETVKADIVIENNSTLDSLYRQIEDKLICKLI